ncbi:MAG: isoprenylcysteine carboxylmethyltransferase family protein [Bacteroidota bacterium]
MKKDYWFVGGQFLLFVTYAFPFVDLPFTLPGWVVTAGLLAAVVGALVVLLAMLQLSDSLSPFPTPKAAGRLVRHGVYAWSRHPIYAGILLAAFGYGVYSFSGYRLLVAVALLVLFNFKAAYEERLLATRYPEYADYRKKVRRFG